MIFGIGVDVTSVTRVEKSLQRLGERFAQRILNPSELPEYRQSKIKSRFLAKRFAIKEAASKALGSGIRDGVSFHDFVTTHNAKGKPVLSVCGVAADKCAEAKISRFHLSLSDQDDLVIAYVVFEK